MIRTIQPGDADAIKAITETSLGHPTSAALIHRRIAELAGDPAYYFAVYEDDATHQVLGFIQSQKYELLYGDRGWNIIALAVATHAQKQGIGKKLLNALEQHAQSSSASFVRLNSRADRTEAHGFYQHLGYRCDKTQLRFIKSLSAD